MVKVLLPLNASPNATTKRKHQALPLNASIKLKHKTLPLMGATRLASGIKAKAHTPNKGSQTALITLMSVSLALKSDAERVAPISDSVLW